MRAWSACACPGSPIMAHSRHLEALKPPSALAMMTRSAHLAYWDLQPPVHMHEKTKGQPQRVSREGAPKEDSSKNTPSHTHVSTISSTASSGHTHSTKGVRMGGSSGSSGAIMDFSGSMARDVSAREDSMMPV